MSKRAFSKTCPTKYFPTRFSCGSLDLSASLLHQCQGGLASPEPFTSGISGAMSLTDCVVHRNCLGISRDGGLTQRAPHYFVDIFFIQKSLRVKFALIITRPSDVKSVFWNDSEHTR